ncbi:hypothetical protein BGX34_004495 [Mortierella sp. NVP85]|nr:hypothetical protein BGX34_004495 [Mortierella sp. NVP85]
MLDLSVSWETTQPHHVQLPDGPQLAGMPSGISADGQDWIVIAYATCYVFNFQNSSWSVVSTDNPITHSERAGYSGVTDPDTGFFYVPNYLQSAQESPMLELDIKAMKINSVPMPAFISAGNNLFGVAWSAANKAMFYYGQQVYRGQLENDTVSVFNPSVGWTSPKTSGVVPPIRVDPCFVSADGGRKMILFGGYSRKTGGTLGDIYILDVTTYTWTAGPSLPSPNLSRSGVACGVSNNQLIIWGGANDNPESTTIVSNEPLIFDLKTNKWASSYTAPVPSTPLANSGNGKGDNSLIAIILGSVIGVLVVGLVV